MDPLLQALLARIRRKIFVSYHHGNDRPFYDLFSKAFCDNYEIIYDNSVEREIDSDDGEYVLRKIREEYITGSSVTIVLCGSHTPFRKFVDWEIKATLDKEHGLIGVQLPTNVSNHAPARMVDNCSSGYALWIEWNALISNPQSLAQSIEIANKRDKTLISNSRPMMYRNMS